MEDDPNLYLPIVEIDEEAKIIHITKPCYVITVYSELMVYLDDHIFCDTMILLAVDRYTFELADGWMITGLEKLLDTPTTEVHYPTISYYATKEVVWTTMKAEPHGNV